MLRIEFHKASGKTTMRIEGRFVGKYAEAARSLISRSPAPTQLNVELSDMTFVDEIGEQVLSWLKWIGVKFAADSSYSRDVCDRLHLPLARKNTIHGQREI